LINERYILKSFYSSNDLEASMRFVEGHAAVLGEYGIKNLNTSTPSWVGDSKVIVVTVTNQENELVGGLRVHIFDGSNTVPLIDALQEIEPSIRTILSRNMPHPTAEVCGLWNSKKIFGKGLSALLCICSVVIARRIKLHDFYCFSAPYTEKMIKTNGLVDLKEVGDEGKFNYPTEEFISKVLYHPSIYTLELAETFNKERIQSLTTNPLQTILEKSPRVDYLVDYDLNL
jgi:hypothetical protein